MRQLVTSLLAFIGLLIIPMLVAAQDKASSATNWPTIVSSGATFHRGTTALHYSG